MVTLTIICIPIVNLFICVSGIGSTLDFINSTEDILVLQSFMGSMQKCPEEGLYAIEPIRAHLLFLSLNFILVVNPISRIYIL